MKIKVLFILIIMCFLTGCYNYREINDLGIASAIGIDKTEDTFKVVAQVVNTQKTGTQSGADPGSANFMIYTNEAKTLQTAYRNILNTSGKKLYINHLTLVVISEEVAKNGIEDILDLFSRDSKFRHQVFVIISKGSSEELLSTVTSLITLNSESIKGIIESNSKFIGTSANTTVKNILHNYLSKKTEIVVPTFYLENKTEESDNSDELKETEVETELKFYSNAIFKNDKLIGYLTEEESLGYNMLMGNTENFLLPVKCDDSGHAVFEITNPKVGIENKKESLEYNITFESDTTLSEVDCKINIQDYKELDKLEKKLNDKIESILESTINNVILNFNSDIFGLRNMIYTKSPSYYEKIKSSFYDKEINEIKLKVSSSSKITSHGNVEGSVKYEHDK